MPFHIIQTYITVFEKVEKKKENDYRKIFERYREIVNKQIFVVDYLS